MQEALDTLYLEQGMLAHACNPYLLEAEAGGSPQVQGQPGLHSENLRKPKQSKTKENTLVE